MTARTVAVTGASGFVGRWLMARLGELGATAVEFFPKGGHGLADAKLINDIVTALKPDAIVHLAAVALPAEANRDRRHAFDINVTGTLSLAEAILSSSPRTRLVYAGSSEAYGQSLNATPDPLKEQAALEPATFYGATKASADVILGQMAHAGLDVVRFRPFNHTGPGQSDSYVVPSFARQIARIEKGEQPPVILVGNLEAERDFLDVRDIVDAYAKAALIDTALPSGSVMNLASGVPRRIGDVLDELTSLSSQDIALRQDPARMRPNETPRATGDASQARTLLGWSPRIPFADTLRDVLEDWRGRDTS